MLIRVVIVSIALLLSLAAPVGAQSYTLITGIDWNSDGTRIAITYLDGQVKVIDASTNQVVLTLQRGSRASVSWHPVNPDHLAVASSDYDAQIIDVTTGTVLHQFQTAVITYSIAFSPDGTHILTSHVSPDGGHGQTGFILSTEVATGAQPVEFESVFAGGVTSAIWSPEGSEIAGLHLGVIRFWDATTGQIVDTISQLETLSDPETGGEVTIGLFRAIDWSPDGTRIVTGDGVQVKVWDRATAQETLVVPFVAGVNDVAWSPDGLRIAIARGTDQLIQIIDANTGDIVNEIPTSAHSRVVAWNPSGTQIAYGTAGELPAIVTLPTADAGPDQQSIVRSVAWNNDGTKVAVAYERVVEVRDTDTNQIMQTFQMEGHGLVQEIAWSLIDSSVLAVVRDSFVPSEVGLDLFDVTTGEKIATFSHEYIEALRDVTWSPDGSRIAGLTYYVTDLDRPKSILIWDITGELVNRINFRGATAIAWSPDGSWIASAGLDNSVRVWDAATGELVHDLVGHTTIVRDVAWQPGGNILASSTGADESMIKIWDIATGQNTITITGFSAYDISWSPDGMYIAAAGASDEVRIWDSSSGLLVEIVTQPMMVTAVAWSPDGTQLAYGGTDGTFIIMPSPVEMANTPPSADAGPDQTVTADDD